MIHNRFVRDYECLADGQIYDGQINDIMYHTSTQCCVIN